MIAAVGGLALQAVSFQASAVEVEHIVLEIEDVIGIPAIQALIAGCVGEEVLFTGTVRTTLKDGEITQITWGGVKGQTLDGDVFNGGSAVATGKQSILTLTEVGGDRQFRLHFVGGELLALECRP